MKKKNWLWVTDPWNTLDHENDTTLRLMREATAMGIKNFWCDVKSLYWHNEDCVIPAQIHDGNPQFHIKPPKNFKIAAFDLVIYRTDPPVDLAYLHPLSFLEQARQNSDKKINIQPPADLVSLTSEKLFGHSVAKLCPKTIAASSLKTLSDFVLKHKKVVLKPMHSCQSMGIEILECTSESDFIKNIETLKSATQNETIPVVLQEYLPGIKKNGETRLWFCDGKCVAQIKKQLARDQHKIDMDHGSTLTTYQQITPQERRAAQQIALLLRKKKIALAAVDLIDGKVTDLNFTSPGLLTALEKTLKTNLAKKAVLALLKHSQ